MELKQNLIVTIILEKAFNHEVHEEKQQGTA